VFTGHSVPKVAAERNRVAKLVSIGKMAIVEEDIPPVAEGEVLIAIRSVGICGSDIHYFLEGGLGSFKQALPMPMGHEPAGVVVQTRTAGFSEGDRVAIEPGRACFTCDQCTKGKQNLCRNVKFMGANAPGALADYVVAHHSQLARISNDTSFDIAALIEPLGVALHAFNLIRPQITEVAVIFGAGPIGLCLMRVLQRAGMKEVYMVDNLPYRVQFAGQMGAAGAFLFKDAVREIKQLTEGRGAMYAFDAAGTQDSVAACAELISVGGTIGLIGIPTADVLKYNPHQIRVREVVMQNVRRSNQTIHDCVKLFGDDAELQKLITHSFDLEDVQKGFDLVSKYGDGVIKCVIRNER
jgi:L-iditol 2-dehydrogenase